MRGIGVAGSKKGGNQLAILGYSVYQEHDICRNFIT
jgi:hypothetical protein